MRRLVLLILSSAMAIGGIYLVVSELFFAHIIFFPFVAGGGVSGFAGTYLLWTDFVAPRLGTKTWEDEA